MLSRFSCPACAGTHVLDFPEDVIIHVTCGTSGKPLRLYSKNGNPKAELLNGDASSSHGSAEESEAGEE